MAKFEHKYPSVVFEDEGGRWAEFSPEERKFGEHTITVGVLEATDAELVKRLRAALKTDPDLSEVKASKET